MDQQDQSGERMGETKITTLSVDITPDQDLPLFGLQNRSGQSTSIRRRLEANILCMKPANGPSLYLVAVDALYGGSIASGLLKRLGVRPSQLLVCGSHTHFAPGVDPDLPRLGLTTPEYVDDIVEKIASGIESAVDLANACVSWGTANSEDLFINRRQPTFGLGIFIPKVGRYVNAPNIRAPIDSKIRVARIMSGARTVAVIWGASCHPVCSPDVDAISPCFPGVVREKIRSALGDDLPVIFLQGFSGDVRPNSQSRKPPVSAIKKIKYLLAGCRLFVAQSESTYRNWCDRLGGMVLGVLQGAQSLSEPITGRSDFFEMTKLPGWARSPRAHGIEIADSFSLFAVNAEVVNERVQSLTPESGHQLVIPVGCCGEVIGYWPTDKMFRQGGYEACGSQCFFPKINWSGAGGADALWETLIDGVRRSRGGV